MDRGPLNSCRLAAPSPLQKQQDRAQPWVPASVAPFAQAPIHACRITICSQRTRHNKGPLSCHSCGAGSQSGPLSLILGIVREGSVGSAAHSHAGKGRPRRPQPAVRWPGRQRRPDGLEQSLHLLANLPSIQEFGIVVSRSLVSVLSSPNSKKPPKTKPSLNMLLARQTARKSDPALTSF